MFHTSALRSRAVRTDVDAIYTKLNKIAESANTRSQAVATSKTPLANELRRSNGSTSSSSCSSLISRASASSTALWSS